MNSVPELVLCIPGPWPSQAALVASVAANSAYQVDGQLLRDAAGTAQCELIWQAPMPALLTAFSKAGPHWARSAAMKHLAGHSGVAYLSGPGGSLTAANAMMRAGAALIEAGGLGVKVDSTGIAHGPAYWLELCTQLDQFSAHRALVVYVSGVEVYSCGMHSFGLPDAITAASNKTAAADMLRFFTRYLLEQQPHLEHGHTFSISPGQALYRIEDEAALDYGSGSLFNNPYNSWRLTPIAPEAAPNWWRRKRGARA